MSPGGVFFLGENPEMSTPAANITTNAQSLSPGETQLLSDDALVSSFGLNSADASEPPLKTDATSQESGAGPKKSDATDESQAKAATDDGNAARKTAEDKSKTEDGAGDEAARAAAGKTTEGDWKDDPELDAEENAAMRATPKEHRDTLKSKLGRKFESHLRDPNKPASEIVDYMDTISPSRSALIRQEIVKRAITDPKSFLANLSDDDFGKMGAHFLQSDPLWFASQLTGREGVKLEDLKTALEGSDRYSALAGIKLPTINEGEDTWDLVEQDYPDIVRFINEVKMALGEGLPASVANELKRLRALEATTKSGGDGTAAKASDAKAGDDKAKPDAEAFHADAGKIFTDVRADWEKYITTYAESPEGLGMGVSKEERDKAPDVADLKDAYVDVYLYGRGTEIPTYEDGLTKWAAGKPAFIDQVKRMQYFCNKGERENALIEARKLRPFFDEYRKERLKQPWFERQTKRIDRASVEAGSAPRVEKLIPGGAGAAGKATESTAGKNPQQAEDDFVNSFSVAGT